jgi:hypothetical protein
MVAWRTFGAVHVPIQTMECVMSPKDLGFVLKARTLLIAAMIAAVLEGHVQVPETHVKATVSVVGSLLAKRSASNRAPRLEVDFVHRLAPAHRSAIQDAVLKATAKWQYAGPWMAHSAVSDMIRVQSAGVGCPTPATIRFGAFILALPLFWQCTRVDGSR